MEDFPHSLCATWHLPIAQNLHEIKFVHLVGVGATVIHVDGEVVLHRSSYSGKSGKDHFQIKSADCLITVISTATIHECILYVNGKRFSEYAKWYSNHFATWKPKIVGVDIRVVLDKSTMELWANGRVVECTTNFTESGTIRNFELDPNMKIPSAIVTSDKEYSNHTLMVDGEMVPLFEEIDEKEHKLEF
ncbi:hypothetical protein L3Y34_000458 [Caenorhabditis briggsae]|uniref:Uncharacterized protein n=1 Tax=Caenorhabditis briggsae TaxID=6238 RepID=A0AAE9INU4_CAEBR|nr:hypothetical protein L3Y34_000458 [Caenorhabditis briggsae]